MILYNHTLLVDKEKSTKPTNILLLKENDSLSINSLFILRLHNNQNRQVAITSNNSFSNIEKNQQVNFLVEDVVTFSSCTNSSLIEYKLHKYGSDKLMTYWLYHTFLPILFTIEDKYYFLHAGAVEVDNKPILFIANSFGGKSTLTNYFVNKNHIFISDDKVGVYKKDNAIISVPSYPFHRPYRRMEDLGVKVDNFSKSNKEIFCIFNLVKSDSKSKINISKISGIEKFKALRYATDIDLSVNKESRFSILSDIGNKIDIYNISIPWDLDRLDEVYLRICTFVKDLNEFK